MSRKKLIKRKSQRGSMSSRKRLSMPLSPQTRQDILQKDGKTLLKKHTELQEEIDTLALGQRKEVLETISQKISSYLSKKLRTREIELLKISTTTEWGQEVLAKMNSDLLGEWSEVIASNSGNLNAELIRISATTEWGEKILEAMPGDLKEKWHGAKSELHKLFSEAYSTKTFKRSAFSKEDRKKAWIDQAIAEAKFYDQLQSEGRSKDSEEVIKEEVIAAIENFERENEGLVAKGIQLRHIIPYSDIAGLMRVATSETTRTTFGDGFVENIREQVTALLKLIGNEEAREIWMAIKDKGDLLKGKEGRGQVKLVYRSLAHSSANLFHGDTSANQSLGNRPDAPGIAVGIHGESHIERLLGWWLETMNLLQLNPQFEEVGIFNVETGKVVVKALYQHEKSRATKAVFYLNERKLDNEMDMLKLSDLEKDLDAETDALARELDEKT